MSSKRILHLLIFGSCMVGPNYEKPEIYVYPKFEESQETEPSSDEDFCGWWKQFNDPLLDAFIAEAIQANYDYKIALEKIVQARAQYRIEHSYLWPEFDVSSV